MAAALAAATLLASTGFVGAGSVSAVITPQTAPAGALAIAQALASPSANVTDASFLSTTAAGTPNGTSTTVLGGFPTNGASFGILTTGDVNSVPNTGTFASTDNLGGTVRGDTDHDVTVLKADVSVPAGANCLTFDFKFLSEEYPRFVGTQYNDAFIAELDTSDWTTSGSTITAPHNFAFDASDNVISINSAGLGMSALNGAGTAFDGTIDGGATGLLHASKQVTSGPHSVYFSIFDQGDNVYDSAVFLDNLTVGFVPDPAVNCKPGATPVNFALTLTPATATNLTGTQHTVTATLKDTAGIAVSGAPILFTVAGANPTTGTGTTDGTGQAAFTYTGTNVGQDQIGACYEVGNEPPCLATASATKDWTAPSADLSLSKAGSPNPVTAGGDITYTLTVSNGGPNSAADATVSDTLPAGVTFKSASPGCGSEGNSVNCQIVGPIAKGTTRQVTIVGTTSQAGTVCNQASVSSSTGDPNGDNNAATVCTTVNAVVTKTCPPTQLCSATTTSPDGTVATITAGPGSSITASFSTLTQAGFTACPTYAPTHPNSVLTFNVTHSRLPKLLKLVENVLAGPIRVCWNAPTRFRQRGGTWSSADPKGGFTGLLPDCLTSNPTLPCVSPPFTKNGIATLLVLAPAGDPKLYP